MMWHVNENIKVFQNSSAVFYSEFLYNFYFTELACRLKALNIDSACEFDESRSNDIISPMPFGGTPLRDFEIKLNRAPAQAPRLPSQFSGDGSIFSSMSKALADIQNSPTR